MKIGILAGPTATGKTRIAIELCQLYGNIEIINADSLLVYRHLRIGTAKPDPNELKAVSHHLIDIRDPNETFTSGEFLREATLAVEQIHARGKRALIVGGTGFYLNSLLFGIWDAPATDPDLRQRLAPFTSAELYKQLAQADLLAAKRIGENDRYRLIRALEIFHLSGHTPSSLQADLPRSPDPRFELWVIDRTNEHLYSRIKLRTGQMIRQGIVEEFQQVHCRYPQCRPLSSVGYAQVKDFLEDRKPSGRKMKPGILGLEEEIALATRQLVKKQRTWFRNQCTKVPASHWFILDDQRHLLEEAFKKVYS